MTELTVPKGTYITTDQLIRANEESIRLSFTKNLNLPVAKLRRLDFVFPVVSAFRHVGYNSADFDNENIRLIVGLSLHRDGRDYRLYTLDVTHDTWRDILDNPPIESRRQAGWRDGNR